MLLKEYMDGDEPIAGHESAVRSRFGIEPESSSGPDGGSGYIEGEDGQEQARLQSAENEVKAISSAFVLC